MQTKELIELAVEAEHLGELSRLVSAFSRRRTAQLGKIELVELTKQTAGAGYRYPTPEPTMQLALALGLVRESARHLILLTETGKVFLKLQGARKLDLTFAQACLVFGLLLDDEKMALYIMSLFRQFAQGQSGRLEAKTLPAFWDDTTQNTARILQQIGIIEEHAATLTVNPAFESLLPRYLLEIAALTEDALWTRLEAQRLRARESEELVVAEERKRLVRLGRRDLSELVVRVSAENVSAGYDIESFQEDGSSRLIEVKSSIGRAIRFEWSVRERETASVNRDRYWIYFVPAANVLKNRLTPIWMLRNPIELLRSRYLKEVPSMFFVSVGPAAPPSRTRKLPTQDALQEWPA